MSCLMILLHVLQEFDLRGDLFLIEKLGLKNTVMLCEKKVNLILEHGGKGVNMFKFCPINLINTRLMLHLRQEMVYSTYFLALEVGQTFLWRLEQ